MINYKSDLVNLQKKYLKFLDNKNLSEYTHFLFLYQKNPKMHIENF